MGCMERGWTGLRVDRYTDARYQRSSAMRKLWLLLSGSMLISCGSNARGNQFRDALMSNAVRVINRFIAADTAGLEAKADSLFQPLGDGVSYCELAFDGYSIVTSGAISGQY